LSDDDTILRRIASARKVDATRFVANHWVLDVFDSAAAEIRRLREENETLANAEVATRTEWEDKYDVLEAENERLIGAIEELVSDEIISAGRARELHRLTPDEQRKLWRSQ
jgi:hypothetical protein